MILAEEEARKEPEIWSTLDEYIENMVDGQDKIYYIMGKDEKSITNSPHLEIYKKYAYDVILMNDPLDPFMLVRVNKYKDYEQIPEVVETIKSYKEYLENSYQNMKEKLLNNLKELIMENCKHEELSVERYDYYTNKIVCEICGKTIDQKDLTQDQIDEVEQTMRVLEDLTK